MPRLFVSHRQQPLPPQQRHSGRARNPTDKAFQTATTPVVQVANTSSSPPSPEVARPSPNATNDEGFPLVMVPPVPRALAQLMDSNDLENPYLVAAFNVLMENNNNPMRVPDILQAVQNRGWTQVLHRHKDRPEQLFGNALRSHQRRREAVGKPSLVFMIDAGSCWKHHQIDLSAASGRKKGKIWCFSKDAGFPCPYTRLGMDLACVIRAQEGSGGASRKDGKDEDMEDEEKPSSEPSRKKRKLAARQDPELLARFEEAVRGSVTSVQTLAAGLQLSPYTPAATHNTTPQEVPYGAHPVQVVPIAQPKKALPLQIIPRSTTTTRARSNRFPEPTIEMDFDALEAMSPEVEPAELEPEVHEEEEPTQDYAFDFTLPTTIPDSHVPIPAVGLEKELESDDDEDDFHVTMNRFLVPPSPPIKLEEEPFMLTSTAPSPIEDVESSDGGASVVRTPTPPLANVSAEVASWSLSSANMQIFDSYPHDTPFHSVGLGFEGWGLDTFLTKPEVEDQGWSRAGSPFARFSEFARSERREQDVQSHIAESNVAPGDFDVASIMEPMDLDTIPFPVVDSMSIVSSRASSVFREGSFESAVGSVRSRTSSLRPRTPLVAVPLPDGVDGVVPRRVSVASACSSRPHSPHPLILYSPALSPSDPERPLKKGLSGRYLVDVSIDLDDDEIEEIVAVESEVKELESLLNLGDDVEVEEPTVSDVTGLGIVSPIPIRTGHKRLRSPSLTA